MALWKCIGPLGLAFALLIPPNVAIAAEKVRVSYQPRETAIPLFIATERGFWKDLDLDPEISSFAAGPQQVAAAASWDVGITGGPPAALGAARFKLLSIAIATNESAMNMMLARSMDADTIRKDPESLKGKQLLVSTNTTGEYAAIACLSKLGLKETDLQIVNLAPAQLISAFSNGSGMLAVTWTPFAYALQDKGGYSEICSGAEAGIIIPSAVVARAEFAKERPDLVAKILAVFFHAVSWAKRHHDEAIAYIKQYNEKNGVVLSQESTEKIYQRSISFTLDQETKMFDRSSGVAVVDRWFSDLSAYLVGTGTLATVQDPKTYLDGRFLKRIDDDAKLRAYATAD
jgi:NitT/TauT family transport system substrate-binding protein